VNKFKDFAEIDLLIGLMYGEGRMVEIGGSDETKEYLGIGCTVRNRTKRRWPDNYKDVILQPKQFSCYNENDPNYNLIYKFLNQPEDNPRLYNKLHHLAELVYNNRCDDFSNSADHYVAAWLYDKYKPGTSNNWYYKYKLVEVWGGHYFFKE